MSKLASERGSPSFQSEPSTFRFALEVTALPSRSFCRPCPHHQLRAPLHPTFASKINSLHNS